VTSVRHLLAPRIAKLRTAALPVLQCALAAALAWLVATDVAGHTRPFFAPIAAIVCLGVSLGSRLRRSVELVVGVSVGIAVADLLITLIGTGAWQIGLVVALAMGAAVLLDGGPVITLQAGSSAVLVATLLPPGQSGGPDRALDALIGGVVALVVVAVLPADPLRSARKDCSGVLSALAESLQGVATGLAGHDDTAVESALQRARGTQAALDALRSDLAAGREIAQLAPLRWRSRARVGRLQAMAEPIDNAARNVRVLARRPWWRCGTPSGWTSASWRCCASWPPRWTCWSTWWNRSRVRVPPSVTPRPRCAGWRPGSPLTSARTAG